MMITALGQMIHVDVRGKRGRYGAALKKNRTRGLCLSSGLFRWMETGMTLWTRILVLEDQLQQVILCDVLVT